MITENKCFKIMVAIELKVWPVSQQKDRQYNNTVRNIWNISSTLKMPSPVNEARGHHPLTVLPNLPTKLDLKQSSRGLIY